MFFFVNAYLRFQNIYIKNKQWKKVTDRQRETFLFIYLLLFLVYAFDIFILLLLLMQLNHLRSIHATRFACV